MSDNYIKFGPTEMIVQFATDRGDWKAKPESTDGGYFLRKFSDGVRFTCVSDELERRLIDLQYRAGESVGIAKQTRNRNTIWKVRIIEPDGSQSVRESPQHVAPHTAIPETKYAHPEPVWPAEVQPAAVPRQPRNEQKTGAPVTPPGIASAPAAVQPKPNGTAVVNSTAPITHTTISQLLKACLCAAIDAAHDAQEYARVHGFPITFGPDQIQDLASTLYIQQSKQANIRQMNERYSTQQSHAANGGRSWPA